MKIEYRTEYGVGKRQNERVYISLGKLIILLSSVLEQEKMIEYAEAIKFNVTVVLDIYKYLENALSVL